TGIDIANARPMTNLVRLLPRIDLLSNRNALELEQAGPHRRPRITIGTRSASLAYSIHDMEAFQLPTEKSMFVVTFGDTRGYNQVDIKGSCEILNSRRMIA
ncbi:MAG TPA: hypothetical protein VFM10_10020, partial [Terriglobales bacterium]|nr:hypothetical protein [Terriglobales bacterium]